MISKEVIDSTLNGIFDNIEFTREPAGLYDPLRYMIEIGGKRIRPRLVLLSYSLFKDSFDKGVLETAAAMEVFHSFTLIHDDIMDKSDTRRGVPTVHCKWDDNTAILSGDVMCIDSYRRIASGNSQYVAQALSLFSRTAAQVCEGQQYDMEFESLESVPMKDYIRMIGLKTGVLLACSARIGALVAGASLDNQKALYEFGYNIGLAFQIADDLLDTFGDKEVFGKPIGGDILNCKKTWLLTKAFEIAGEHRGELAGLLALPIDTDAQKEEKISRVRAFYTSLGIEELAVKAIKDYHSKALSFLDTLEVSRASIECLRDFADSLVSRCK